METPTPPANRLIRSRTDRVLAGVAGGLGQYFQIDSILFRMGFIALTLFGGLGIPLYLVAWFLTPDSIEVIQEKPERPINSVHIPQKSNQAIGGLLIAIGVIILAARLGIFALQITGKIWPVILIIAGIVMFNRNRSK